MKQDIDKALREDLFGAYEKTLRKYYKNNDQLDLGAILTGVGEFVAGVVASIEPDDVESVGELMDIMKVQVIETHGKFNKFKEATK